MKRNLYKRLEAIENTAYIDLIVYLEQWCKELCELWSTLPEDTDCSTHEGFIAKLQQVVTYCGDDTDKRHFAANWIDSHMDYFVGVFNEQLK